MQLRLFDPTDGPEDGDNQITLREAYTRYLLPDQRGTRRAPSTRSDYQTTLKHWEESVSYTLTIAAITDDTLREFQDKLEAKKLGSAAINKNLRNIRAILRRCGPRDGSNPHGKGLLLTVPYVEPLPQMDRKRKRIIPPKDLELIYKACSEAKLTDCPVPAPLLCRTAFVLAYSIGARRGDLLSLRWSDVTFGRECPDIASDAVNPSGWISYVPTKTRRKKGDPLHLPLTVAARGHLDAVRKAAPHVDRVFPLSNSVRHFDRLRLDIQRAAKIANPYGWHDFRRTCNTALIRTRIHGAGDCMLGHAPRGVNAAHYVDAPSILVDAIGRMEQPEPFSRIFVDHPEIRRRLA